MILEEVGRGLRGDAIGHGARQQGVDDAGQPIVRAHALARIGASPSLICSSAASVRLIALTPFGETR